MDGSSFWLRSEICPNCGAYERDRDLRLYVHSHDPAVLVKEGVFLHFAPEDHLRNVLAENEGLTYAASDIALKRIRPLKGRAFQSDILSIPLADCSVAVVFCSHLLEHLRDDTAGIAEIERVMAPGAIAYIIVPIDSRLEKTVFLGHPTRKFLTITGPMEWTLPRSWPSSNARLLSI